MIAKDYEHEIVIEKSRFICHIKRVFSQEEALNFIHDINKKHAKANHNCIAYQIGNRNEIQKANDDGEPSGTAGIPMLDVLKRQDIRNCLVIITRYFGGIKLGSGGLIRAYSRVTSETIKVCGLVRCEIMKSIFIECDYSLAEKLQGRIINAGYDLGQPNYSEKVKLEILVTINESESFCEWITDLSNNEVTITIGDTSFKEIPYSH